MDGEFNNLSTNNINVTFTNTPNNTALSDELTADPIYTRKMGTAYSVGKKVKVGLIAVSSTLIVAGGALTLLRNFSFSNAYLGSIPTISNTHFAISTTEDSLEYSFDIQNKGSLVVIFDVTVELETIQSLDCSKTGTYTGTIENLGYGKNVKYVIYCTNNVDYKKVLSSGSYVTIGQ